MFFSPIKTEPIPERVLSISQIVADKGPIDEKELDAYYDRVAQAYHTIYRRIGIPEVVAIQSDTGMMGGKVAHEYQLVTDCGEDKVVMCDKCKSYWNSEVASTTYTYEKEELLPLEEVATPNTKTIEDLVKLTGILFRTLYYFHFILDLYIYFYFI